MKLTIGVKDIVHFLYASGDVSTVVNADIIGNKIHQYWQSLYTENDVKEYFVKNTFHFFDYEVTVHGFIDGLLENNVVEEIKTSFVELKSIDYVKNDEHMAQLKFYAYLFAYTNNLDSIEMRLTYIHYISKEDLCFNFVISFSELEEFFNKSMNEYITWIAKLDMHSQKLLETAYNLAFPFTSYRSGQESFIEECMENVINKQILYAIAPTGVGKTISTLFSAIKSLNKKNQKIFYLTAKTSGKRIAIDTINLLIEKNAEIKAIELSAKEKVCLLGKKYCKPETCMYLNGYYSKLKNAIYEIYDSYDVFDAATIREIAIKHEICPFEFSLDLSYYADIIIGDYNYAFCPRTHLARYFDTEDYEHILLVDESHNFINRAKEMFSASICLEDIYQIGDCVSRIMPSINSLVNSFALHVQGYEREFNYMTDVPNDFYDILRKILIKCETALASEEGTTIQDMLLPYYYNVKNFFRIYEYYDEDYRFTINYDTYSICCLDASKFIKHILDEHSISSTFFSATMFPIDYYKKLITMGIGNEISIPSPFDPHNLLIIIRRNANTRYNYRNESIDDIIDCIDEMIKYRTGNYIVFFPSYEYMNMIVECLDDPDYECIIQSKHLSEEERDAIIKEFETCKTTKVGFFVMGGVFSEGIDYIGNMLSGVMIVSVSLPMIGGYNEMLREHFDNNEINGFAYAYQIPGMAKVIQSVGRVIRSETDKGIAILYDDRFCYSDYRKMMPDSWKNIKYAYDKVSVRNLIYSFKNKPVW